MRRSTRIAGLLLALVSAGCRPGTSACKQLCRPTQPTTLDRVAGQPGGSGHVDGALADAHFRDPWQLACDGAGHAYLTEDGANDLRAIDLKSGQVSTLAGQPNVVGSEDGIGSAATFHGPSALALGGGRLYVADVEHHLLRVVELATRRVTTLGGKVNAMGWKDGPLASAMFNEPEGLAIDGDSLYVGDTDNDMIRRIDLRAGTVGSVAGAPAARGSADGPAKTARFYKPMSVATDGQGHLYVCDTLNNLVRAVQLPGGAVTTLARLPATPLGIRVVGGDVVVGLADHRVVRIDPKSGAVRDWLGAAGKEGFVDASGTDARFSRPAGMCLDGAGNLYVADSGNHVVRSVALASGAVTTLAGTRSTGASDGDVAAARFAGPLGLVWDPSGAYYVADTANSTIRKVALADGRVTTIAGSAGEPGAVDGRGAAARFNHPQGLALDGRGHLYVADADNRLLRRVDLQSGAVTTLAPAIERGLRPQTPTGLAWWDDALFVSDYAGQVVLRIDPTSQRGSIVAGKPASPGAIDGRGAVARFNGPQSIAADGRGNLYVADVGNGAIRKLAGGAVTTVAGGKLTAGFGHEPPFNYPTHVAANGLGDLFVSDAGNSVVRRVELPSGRVTTLVGNWSASGVQLGALPAQLGHPSGLALSDDGHLAILSENTLLIAR